MDAHIVPIEHQFDFIGENLCLDFANTFGGLPAESESQERLLSYGHLVAWSQQANLISENEALVLLHNAANAAKEAAAILQRAIAVREAIRGIFAAVAYKQEIAARDLELFNGELEWAMAGARMIVTGDSFELAWRNEAGALDQMLAPVVRAAAMLMTSDERQFVKECANDPCHWLFVDTTKNHRRRWCRTAGCGNMVRVRKHRERQRGQDGDGEG